MEKRYPALSQRVPGQVHQYRDIKKPSRVALVGTLDTYISNNFEVLK